MGMTPEERIKIYEALSIATRIRNQRDASNARDHELGKVALNKLEEIIRRLINNHSKTSKFEWIMVNSLFLDCSELLDPVSHETDYLLELQELFEEKYKIS